MNTYLTILLFLAVIFLIWKVLQKSGKKLSIDQDQLRRVLGTSKQSTTSKKEKEPRYYIDSERILGKNKGKWSVDTGSILGDWGKGPSKKSKGFKGYEVDFSGVLGKKKR